MSWLSEVAGKLGGLVKSASVSVGAGQDGRLFLDTDVNARQLWTTEYIVAAVVLGVLVGVWMKGGK